MNEKDLYLPLINFFEKKLSSDLNLNIRLWEGHRGIPKELEELCPRLQDFNTSIRLRFLPDLIGFVEDNGKKKDNDY